jgi:hypothetical protein
MQLITGRYATLDPSMGVPVGIMVSKPTLALRCEAAAEIDDLKPRDMFGCAALFRSAGNESCRQRSFEFRAELDRLRELQTESEIPSEVETLALGDEFAS